MAGYSNVYVSVLAVQNSNIDCDDYDAAWLMIRHKHGTQQRHLWWWRWRWHMTEWVAPSEWQRPAGNLATVMIMLPEGWSGGLIKCVSGKWRLPTDPLSRGGRVHGALSHYTCHRTLDCLPASHLMAYLCPWPVLLIGSVTRKNIIDTRYIIPVTHIVKYKNDSVTFCQCTMSWESFCCRTFSYILL